MFPHLFPQFFLVSKHEISNYISKVLQKSADGIIIQSIKKSITHRKAIKQPARHAAVLWFISRMLVPKHAFNKVRKQVLMKSCQSVLLTLLIKQSNDLLYTYFSIPPPGGQQPMACQRSYLRSGQFKVAQISALCAQQDALNHSEKEYTLLRCETWLTSFVVKHFFSLRGESCKRDESVASSTSVLRGVERGCAVCDLPGRRALRFYFWWVDSLSFVRICPHTMKVKFCAKAGGFEQILAGEKVSYEGKCASNLLRGACAWGGFGLRQ